MEELPEQESQPQSSPGEERDSTGERERETVKYIERQHFRETINHRETFQEQKPQNHMTVS